MLNKWNLRRMFEARGPRGFVHGLYHLIGLSDANGRRHRDRFGRPIIKDPQLHPSEIPTHHLAEAILGEDREAAFQGDGLERFGRYSRLMESRDPQNARLLESGGGGIDVSQFLHINAYSAVVGGMIEFSVIEGFERPGYPISEQLFPSKPTKTNGRRKGRIGGIGDEAEERLPGMPTKRVGLTEEWIDVPETHEFALSIEVNQEAPFFDLTGDILPKAQAVGEAIKYRKEIRCIDVFAGITNPYEYNDTAYNTYLATDPPSTQPEWLNDLVNALVDETSFDTALQVFTRMTDPATGLRIVMQPDTVVSVPSLDRQLHNILNPRETEQRTQSSAEARYGPAWISGKISNVIISPLLHMRLRDTTGAALSEANSKRWWLIAKGSGGPFAYDENWPLKVQSATPTEKDMIDRGIIAFHKASERGVPYVEEPRKAFRNKVA